MKIVHLCLCGPYNDNWGYQENIIPKYNKKDGHDVTVLTSIFVDSTEFVGYEKVEPGQYYLDDGVKVIRIPFKRSSLNKIVEKLRIYEDFYLLLENEKPDLIFMHGIQFIDMGVVVNYIKNNPNCKLVADNHASYENSGNNILSREVLHKVIYRRTIQKSLNYIKKIYSITPGCQKFAMDMYNIPEEKMEYLYLGIDIDRVKLDLKEEINAKIRKQYNISNEDFVLISGGKLSKGKNVELLLDSFKEIKTKNIKLILFGEFSKDINILMLEKLKQDNRIIYIGWQSPEEINNLYLASDLAVFPGSQSSLWQQAIGCGLPAIFKQWEGIEYLDLGGNCIFLNNSDSKEELIRNINLLISNNELYKRMKLVAEDKGFEMFSYESISRRAIEI